MSSYSSSKLTVVNNYKNSDISNTHHGTAVNYKTLESSIAKKLESSLHDSLFAKLNVKFDKMTCDINRNLEALVDAKVRKYFIESGQSGEFKCVDESTSTYTPEELDDLIKENIPKMVESSVENFAFLNEVSKLAKLIYADDPTISNI